MGYTTEFSGTLEITPALNEAETTYLRTFSTTRRMQRNEDQLRGVADPIREAVHLPVGHDGAYFIGIGGDYRDDPTAVTDYNTPPGGRASYDRNEVRPRHRQPGLWCQWTIDEDGHLAWDEGEKFYDYTDWLEYLIEHFFKPWGHTLQGRISWSGEETGDTGVIVVINNVVGVVNGPAAMDYAADHLEAQMRGVSVEQVTSLRETPQLAPGVVG